MDPRFVAFGVGRGQTERSMQQGQLEVDQGPAAFGSHKQHDFQLDKLHNRGDQMDWQKRRDPEGERSSIIVLFNMYRVQWTNTESIVIDGSSVDAADWFSECLFYEILHPRISQASTLRA